MNKKIIGLLLWILVFQMIGYLTGIVAQHDIATWYQGLQKSSLTPPGIVFPIVWSILYVLLAIVGWMLWHHRRQIGIKQAFLFFAIQMVMNWTWTPIFFNFHWIGFAFFWLLGIIIFTLLTVFYSYHQIRLITYLLIPYLCWLVFAAYLNGIIFYFEKNIW